MITIIAKNQTVSDIIIGDLSGAVVPGSGQYTLTDSQRVSSIYNSDDLLASINADDILLNDGVGDLTKTESIDFIKQWGTRNAIERVTMHSPDNTVFEFKVENDGDINIGGKTISITKAVNLSAFGPTTNVATGDGKVYFPIPSTLSGMNLTGVAAYVITAGTTGTTDIQVHNVTDVVDMLSTKMTIDSGETSTATAATPPVINASNDDVSTNDMLRIDVDAISTTPPKGLIITLEFTSP